MKSGHRQAELIGHLGGPVDLESGGQGLRVPPRQQSGERCLYRLDPGRQLTYGHADVNRPVPVVHQPARGPLDQRADLHPQRSLGLSVDLVVQRPDPCIELVGPEDRPGSNLGPDHVRRAGAGLGGQPVEAADP